MSLGKSPILVTGFEPFGGDAVNPSALVAQALHDSRIGNARVIGLVLPCVFGAAIEAMQQALAEHKPRLVLALGLAASRSGFSLERVAINLDDARIPDNAGAQPVDMPVIRNAPAAHFSTLPIKAMVAALRNAGYAAEVSNSAGTFVCNHVFFALQHALRHRRSARSGFMHLPPLQGERADGLNLADQAEGVRVALRAAWLNRDDLRASEGAVD